MSSEPLRVVHYINQFFGGLGGEEAGGAPVSVKDGPMGPGLGLAQAFGNRATIVNTIICGDNYFNDHTAEALSTIMAAVGKARAQVVVAGPAFNAGRYGLACGAVCRAAREAGVPAITAMFEENPAVELYRLFTYIVPTTGSAAGMRQVLPKLAELAIRLAQHGKLGPAFAEGYLPTGHRYNEYDEHTAAQRVVAMMLKKLKGEPFHSEIPLRGFEVVPPAAPLSDLTGATLALVTGGGIVPEGNPDRLKQAFSVAYGAYDMTGLDGLPSGAYVGIHGGYDCGWANEDPNRVVPLDGMRRLVQEGRVGGLYHRFFSTCGIGTNIANAKRIGAGIARELLDAGVQAAIYTST